MSDQAGLTIDEILEQVGSCGFYQIRFVLLLSYIAISIIFPIAELTFLTAEPPWKCSANSTVCNMTGLFSPGDDYYKKRCSMDRSEWEFSDPFTSPITEFDLVCSRTFLGSFSSSIVFLGWLVAALIGGVIADKFGRKFIMIIFTFNGSLFALLSAFPTVYWLFVLLRCLMGFSVGCAAMPLFVIVLEYVGIRHRHVASTCIWFATAGGYMVMAGMAYGIRDWRNLTIATSVVGLPSILFLWLIPESARFLQLKGKYSETEEILRKIATTNKKSYPEKPLIKYKKENMGNFLDLFRTRRMTHITCVSCFSWFVNAMVFYGVIFSSPNLGSNLYLSFFLANVVNFPGHAICIFCQGRFGRKKTVVWSMLIASVFAMATVLLTMYDPGSNQGYQAGQLIMAILAKLAITVSFDGIYVYSAELFPTVVRNIGLGSSSALARVGSFSAPFVTSLNRVHVLLPYAIMGGASLLAGLMCWTLPETKSVPTAEVMGLDPRTTREPADTEKQETNM